MGRIAYFSASVISKKSNNVLYSLKLYKISNLIRYLLLLAANFFNISAYIYTHNSVYIIIIAILVALTFAYKYRFNEFNKEFISASLSGNIQELRIFFE
jgi:hypothetical protein